MSTVVCFCLGLHPRRLAGSPHAKIFFGGIGCFSSHAATPASSNHPTLMQFNGHTTIFRPNRSGFFCFCFPSCDSLPFKHVCCCCYCCCCTELTSMITKASLVIGRSTECVTWEETHKDRVSLLMLPHLLSPTIMSSLATLIQWP